MERAQLIREVVEAFDDDGALLVLADRLQLAGDPLGELIVNQTVPGKVTAKRMSELERAVRKLWVGPLADVVDAPNVGFRRGIPSRVVLKRKATTLRVADALWPLVETVDLDRHAGNEVPLLLARMPRLARLEGALPAIVASLDGTTAARLAALGCYLGRGRTAAGRYVTGGLDPAAVARLSATATLRALRHGDRFEASQYRWLWSTPCGNALERLSVSNINNRTVWGPLALGAWWQELQRAPATLQELELTEHDDADFETRSGWCIRFTRGANGAFSNMHASYMLGLSRIVDPLERLAGGLAELAPGSITSFTLARARSQTRLWAFPLVEKQWQRLRCEVVRDN